MTFVDPSTPIIGKKYYFLFKDDHYGFKIIYSIKEKLIGPECYEGFCAKC
jgi:hypothetical protein